MPWELQIRLPDGSGSLGSLEQVQAMLRAALPEIELFRDASGLEKLAAMEASGVTVPDVIREHWLRSKGAYQGVIEAGALTFEFYLREDETAVRVVLVEVRGSGDPMPVVERITSVPGWKVVDARGAPPTVESWKSFGAWRDDAIGRIDGAD